MHNGIFCAHLLRNLLMIIPIPEQLINHTFSESSFWCKNLCNYQRTTEEQLLSITRREQVVSSIHIGYNNPEIIVLGTVRSQATKLQSICRPHFKNSAPRTQPVIFDFCFTFVKTASFSNMHCLFRIPCLAVCEVKTGLVLQELATDKPYIKFRPHHQSCGYSSSQSNIP